MQNLFDADTYDGTIYRLNQLTPDSTGLWGKMKVSQMLAHCKAAFKVPLAERKLSRAFIGILIGWAFKSKLYNESPWLKNLPTAPDFKITDERIFDKEKKELRELIDRFHTIEPEKVSRQTHPMFGKLTAEQWGQAMYKHLDHHFRQFGV
jgi:hypothetical protein